MSKKMVIAQLGCGYWGPNLLRSFVSQSDCWMKWVAEPNKKRMAYLEQNFPTVRPILNYEQVLDDPEVKAVVIATPASTHYSLARNALLCGKNVFVEKPLAMSVVEADELIRLSTERGLILMVGHTYLYNPAVTYLKEFLDKKEIGQLYYIYSHRLNLGQVRSDVNVWWNLGPHDVSVLLYLMGGQLPEYISAQGADYLQPNIHDVVFVTLRWASGVVAHVQLSWLNPAKVREMTLVGSKRMIVYDDVKDDKIAIFDKGVDRVPVVGEKMDYDLPNNFQLRHRSGDIVFPRIDFKEPLKLEAAHFLECLRTGATPLTDGRHARSVVAVLEGGQTALEESRIVTLGPAQLLAA
ncbi:MAG: Gfo/Idh/MocA family oxidoreductase [Deltaproteobacteria bacterium]|nr:Gfo/Idh/MocA family oxidoreductase [Deltaproteobacteria bacterium]